MTRVWAGFWARDYFEYDEAARRILRAKDRDIRRAELRACKAEDALEFIAWAIREEGTRDPAWTIDRIRESLETVGTPKGSSS